MTLLLNCRIVGVPVPQARPRAYVRGKHASVYDPHTNLDWKRTVQAQVLPIWAGREPSPAALRVEMTFHLARPKSLPKRVTQHVRKPDLNNFVKSVEDALNGVVWVDDSQVVQVVAEKVYDSVLGVSLRVFEMEGGR